jgi:hypothetical protein
MQRFRMEGSWTGLSVGNRTRIPTRRSCSKNSTTFLFELIQKLEHARFWKSLQTSLVQVLQTEFEVTS